MEEVGGGSDGIHHELHAQGGTVHRLVDAQRVKIGGVEEVKWVRAGSEWHVPRTCTVLHETTCTVHARHPIL